VHTNEAIDSLYFASTLRDPNQLDQQMARPLALADRVTDLARNVFGFSSDRTEWQNRVPIVEGMPVDAANPNLPPIGPVIGWVELPGGVGSIEVLQKEPLHLLETDSRNFWLMMSPGYGAGMFETESFAEFQSKIGQKIDQKRAHMKDTVQRSLKELSHVLDENVAQIKEEAAQRGQTQKLPADEELRYEAYREMASSPANPGDLLGGLVLQAESSGLDSGEIGRFERRMTAEMVKEVGNELRRSVREFRSDMISRALFKKRTDEDIELVSFSHLGPRVMPIVQKAKLLKVDAGKVGQLSDELLALAVIHEIELGTYLQSVPEEHREAIGGEHQKMGLVVKNGTGWALNSASPLIQKMVEFRTRVFAERKMVEERMRALDGGQEAAGVTLHEREIEAVATKAFPPIDLETESGQARAAQLAVQTNPNGAVATSYRFQDSITRLAILGLLSRDELNEYRDFLGLSFPQEQR
ncbi:MAG: hypothetical protein Q7S98_03865, partial [Deltaproteobacteria bacterium]|nr:hypothetical protein [Deltaproteobacteria bacterium]